MSCAVDGPVKSLIHTGDQFVLCLGDKVAEPFGLQHAPESLDGVKVRRIGRQEDRLEAAPGQRPVLMPGRIIADQQISRTLEGNILIGLVQERLERFHVTVAEFQGVELSRTRADQARRRSFEGGRRSS